MMIGLKLKNPALNKIKSNNSLKIDLDKIIKASLKPDNSLELSIPIKGDLSKPAIDFKKIFFEVFISLLNNKTIELVPKLFGFQRNNEYDLIYFRAGTDQFLQNYEPSQNVLLSKNSSDVYFMVEGYVDRHKDTLALKNILINEKITALENTGIDEAQALKLIYVEYFNTEPVLTDLQAIKKEILDKILITESDLYSLSYKRMRKIYSFLSQI